MCSRCEKRKRDEDNLLVKFNDGDIYHDLMEHRFNLFKKIENAAFIQLI